MKGLLLQARWEPKKGYRPTEFELKTKKAITSSSVWRYPEITLCDLPDPKIGPKDVLLKIKACGICGSDVHLYEKDDEGYVLYPGLARFPTVLGHEFSGVIEEVGDEVKGFKIGDMVTAEEMNWCGECIACKNGYPNHCTNLEEIGITINGGLAEYLAVKAKYCWKINNLMDIYGDEDKVYEAGALVEPTSVAYNALFVRGEGFKPGSYIVIYGAGPIGLAAIALAKSAGAAKVIVFETIKERRELAKKMGADYVFDPTDLEKKGSTPHQIVLDITGGAGADFQVEAAGVPIKTIPEMEKSLAINGKIVQIGRAAERVPIYLEALQVRRGQIYGSQGHSGHSIFQNVIRLMSSGIIDMTKIITARYDLREAVDAIKRATTRRDGKIIVRI